MTLPFRFLAYVLFLTSGVIVSAGRPGFLRGYEGVQRQLDSHITGHDIEDGLKAELQWFEQKLDHFNPASTDTWLQRYAERLKFYEGNSVVFLFINGPGVIRREWLKHSHMGTLAEKFKAAEFIIEHRFYGGSKPKPDLTLESLRYLSSEQALADIAFFIKRMNSVHGFNNPKWIVFGGSYAGSLATWLRYKYPHLVFAAVSSSAPLHAKVDFPEYFQAVSDSLTSVSPKCVDAIKAGIQKLSDGMNNATKREHYRKIFRLCDPLEYAEKDVQTFFNEITLNFVSFLQDNQRNTDTDTASIDMNAACKIMTDESIHCPVHRIAEVNRLHLAFFGENCTAHKYNGMVEWLSDTSYGPETNFWRQWYYQTCIEFGRYPSRGKKGDTFGDQTPVQFYIDLCTDVYGPRFNGELLNTSTEATNTHYGAYSLPVSRVVFVHGSIDPNSSLGITKNPPEGSYVILIKGTAKFADMFPETRDDPDQLIKARTKIEGIVGDWINGKKHQTRKGSFVFED